MTRVAIASLGIWHPSTTVDNNWFIEHYAAQGIDVSGLLNALGHKNRYLIRDSFDTTLTMSVKASNDAIRRLGCQAKDLDLVAFASQTPEYLIPATALKIHHAIGGGERAQAFDINANCVGLVVAVDIVARAMMARPSCQLALVVGGDYLGAHSSNEPVYHSCFSEVAVAVILHKTEQGNGLIDSESRIQTSVIDNSLFPACGLSNIHRHDVSAQVKFTPFDDAICISAASESIRLLLSRNNLTPEDINGFMFSQFSIGNIRQLCEELGVDQDKALFISDEYGYTATNSPFVAFYEAIKRKKISRGDLIVFWSVGAGWQSTAILMKY
ncbi:3-oxoacyl-[acyl-carrier-protein] synthase III C-terminal domain-containing protein [Xenorhabdus sp. PB62.4]|uniref:3-oxoacyl-[acyl-carrier-protein] synthase III C-terminal domain-containing protein n=1 Tax=Xenorhabdus sp. PB62.4 TaxID=1851573 RepID=UPI001656AFDF|nr:3-oxoacyl-[acyl-carrier-protein] synthase III C-terminal domain-containing protein [Xenorhabdus sp. PB62.4]